MSPEIKENIEKIIPNVQASCIFWPQYSVTSFENPIVLGSDPDSSDYTEDDEGETTVVQLIKNTKSKKLDEHDDWVLSQSHEQGLAQESDSEDVSLVNTKKN